MLFLAGFLARERFYCILICRILAAPHFLIILLVMKNAKWSSANTLPGLLYFPCLYRLTLVCMTYRVDLFSSCMMYEVDMSEFTDVIPSLMALFSVE